MKNPGTIAAASILALALAGLACAQGPMGGMLGPQPRGIFNPIVGSGAQYEIQRGAQDANAKKITMEIAVIGKEAADGKDGYWLETSANTPVGDMVVKVLTVQDGANTTFTRTIMQMAGRPATEMPQMGRMQQKQSLDIRSEADKVGSESVTTPAGDFTADHYRMKNGSGDFWVSDKVSPYGLIKYQGKDMTMVLIKQVKDAKDKITGTPVPFNPALMMGGGQAPQ
jgi:hypothetical protein